MPGCAETNRKGKSGAPSGAFWGGKKTSTIGKNHGKKQSTIAHRKETIEKKENARALGGVNQLRKKKWRTPGSGTGTKGA